ncbi:MAG: hypothetical protein HYS13_14770 [Planctomycetia bacterium]|nr:hypothetical protein [Planctomycetia bacterium]
MRIQAVGRRNYPGERQFFIVHPYDGVRSPLDPVEFQGVMQQLVARIPCPFDYLISLDGPALLAGMLAAIVTRRPLRVATKADLQLPRPIKFAEPGSVNPVFLYDLPPGRVVIVDDEIRTGRTVLACAEALARHGIEVAAVIVPVASTKFGVAGLFEQRGVPLVVHEWHDF